MNRRGFLGAILAAGAAPAIIKVENAMRLWVPKQVAFESRSIGVQTIWTADAMYADGTIKWCIEDIISKNLAKRLADEIDARVFAGVFA